MKTDTDPTPDPRAETDNARTVIVSKSSSAPSLPSRLGAEPEPKRKGPGVATKFFVASALLVGVALGASITVATVRSNQIAEATIRGDLAKVPAMLRVYQNDLEAQLRATVHSIAVEPGTTALLAEGVDLPTRHEWAVKKAALIGANTVFLFDKEGRLLARSDKTVEELDPLVGQPFGAVKWVRVPIDTWADASATIREKDLLAAVASASVVAGEKAMNEARLEGVVAASFGYDKERADALKGITGGQVGFAINTAKKDQPPALAVTTETAGFGGAAIFAGVSAAPGALDTLFKEGKEVGPVDVPLASDLRIVKAVPLKNAAGETLGAFAVSRSRDEETAAFREIRNTLLLVGGLALLLAIPVSFALGRGIARPIEELAAGARQIREGNLDVKLPEAGGDEVGLLARAFRGMVSELKEKRELEQMVAEMAKRPRPELSSSTTATTTALPEVSSAPGDGPRIGAVFAGRYDIVGTLGKGGMGAVYRAMDRELDDDIALKVLMPEAFDEGTQATVTLKQEIKLARRITHQNVVRTHDLGEYGGTRFITMEYVPGTTLREVVDRKNRLAIAPGLQIAKQLCRGLGAVHEAGIIHRDIKPHNIMVLPNGVVKLMDFGIARNTEGVDPTTQMGQTVGTPYYMSPEQARGQNLDPRSDLYSVGVVLYELFTGERPFEGKDPQEVMIKHVSVDARRPSALRPDLPPLLERIILACLSKDREKRPPTANDLYGALMRVT
ncbi:MAG: protein kinase [Acidobacteria bacterium]|nr:protein kinase [Acidobacteriota bacterium]